MGNQKSRTELVWHRRDLRPRDNMALAVATGNADPDEPDELPDVQGDEAVPVYVIDTDCLDHASPNRLSFMLDALTALRSWYRSQGSDLVIEYGDPVDVIPELVDRFDADRVNANATYSGLSKRRDDAVDAALDVDLLLLHDEVHHEPGVLVTKSKGTPYQKFGAFHKRWVDLDKADPYPTPDADSLADVDGDPVPPLDELGFDEPTATIPGAAAVKDRVSDWFDESIYTYADDRDNLARSMSRLSVDLTWGTVGIRELWSATDDAIDNAPGDGAADSVREYQRQLCWREFAYQILDAWPSLVHSNHGDFPNGIDWRQSSSDIERWHSGTTGVPLVDAGMRQLKSEGYMHNRARMNVASFLTKDLRIHWIHGYRWFKQHLVDHNPANDAYGWQWAASTGPDGQAYWRAMSPFKQAEKCDPNATYIRKHVPELRDCSDETILGWNDLTDAQRQSGAPDYYSPMVDHNEASDKGTDMIMAGKDC
jgi:deoxyribodipyrimidine photo-lyase